MKFVYIGIFGFLLVFAGCSSEEEIKAPLSAEQTYLTITRAEVEGKESINEDREAYEDRVHTLAILIFDSYSGKKIVQKIEEDIPVSETNNNYILELTPGTRDFYFIANRPPDELRKIREKSAMDNYLEDLKALDAALYQAATENKGFPMSRVYLQQEVPKGGTPDQPIRFTPGNENRIKLIRAVAKLEVDLSSVAGQVSEVRYYHANRNFNLSSPTGVTDADPYYTDSGKDYVTLQGAAGKYLFYMPELKMPANVRWDASASAPINYFEVVFTNSESYKIPIITNGGDIADYMAFVKTDEADFDILRNDHYLYKITKSNKNIEILYNVLPWNLVKKTMYMGYWFNVVIGDDGSVEVINTIADCMPHKVYLKAVNGAYFETEADVLKVFGYDERDADVNPLKLKEGYAEQFKINTSKVQTGVYLEIYYNQHPDNTNALPVKKITK